MTEQPDPTQGRRPLTTTEAARVNDARNTLNAARAADLGDLEAAALRATTKRLCAHLDDILTLVECDTHGTRTDFARLDLAGARAALLSPADPAGLILVIERLRTRLDDVLNLVDEITDASPPSPE